MNSKLIAEEVAAVGQIEAVSRILEVVCRTTGLGFSAVARVTETQWIACAVRDEISFGLEPSGELELETTLCDEIRQSGELVVIEDAETDELYSCHRTPKLYGFRSYISAPIFLSDGRFFGTLCAIDPSPAQLKKPETVEMFRLFASLIAFYFEAQRQLAVSEKVLLDEQNASQLREQFIAVLGHDLRNPLGAIKMGTRLLSRSNKDDQMVDIFGMIDRSVDRMAELIDNVMDLAGDGSGAGSSSIASPKTVWKTC